MGELQRSGLWHRNVHVAIWVPPPHFGSANAVAGSTTRVITKKMVPSSHTVTLACFLTISMTSNLILSITVTVGNPGVYPTTHLVLRTAHLPLL